MRHATFIAVCASLLVIITGAFAATATTRPGTPPMPAQFNTLLNHSIFVKGRVRTPPSTRPTSRPIRQPVEATLVFNGVTRVESQLTAFIENRSTGQMTVVQLHDSIAQGRIVDITLDTLEYEANGQITRIAIGDNFQGTPAGEPTSRPATTDSAAPATPEMQSVLERLRQRRMNELKKD